MIKDRTWVQVDLNNIIHNLREIRSVLPASTGVMGVVKADGYGHGSVEVGRILEVNSIEYLAVATVDEALELRANGISVPVLCLGFTDEQRYKDIIDFDITQTIFSYDSAVLLSKMALKKEKTANIHLKVDTGMNRIGFFAKETSLEEIINISKLPEIHIEGIFSHLSSSEIEDESYSNMQFEIFREFCDKLADKGVRPQIKHISNSGAIVRLPHMSLDMVRTGLMLYGYYPDESLMEKGVNLKPALSFRSRIIYVKDIPVGSSVSYGRRFTAQRPSRIATVPVGYADGYPRLLSCKGRVIVRGEYAPVVGTVCMDQMMIDVTDCKETISVGDEVILIGTQNGRSISAEDVAAWAETINYEIVCRIGKRVPKVY